jgi:hypothetical protein
MSIHRERPEETGAVKVAPLTRPGLRAVFFSNNRVFVPPVIRHTKGTAAFSVF